MTPWAADAAKDKGYNGSTPSAMGITRLTPETVARIAAGEVIERPASVAKELVENALDAGASQIQVEVREGGVGLLKVVDDGVGIPAEEVRAAFDHHATSKLTNAEDLDAIETLGFRGEALASITAVADVTLVTRTRDEPSGCVIRVARGEIREEGPRGAPPGTSVTVRHLFQAVPARFKFLRSNGAEAARVSTVVAHYALAYPDVRFSLSVDSRQTFSSQGGGDMRGALASLYGAETSGAMLDVSHQERLGEVEIGVTGMISPPALCRANRTYITLFVNRRLIQSRSLTFAVIEAYRGLLSSNRYPIAILNLDIDPRETDVNVHPAKAEIKFRDEGMAFSALHHAVGQRLSGTSPVRPMRSAFEAPSPVTITSPVVEGGRSPPALEPPEPKPRPETERQEDLGLPVLRVLGQLRGTFIVAEGPEGMYLVDQHTAHERVLFDQLRRDKDEGRVQAQGLLEPVAVDLAPEQEHLLLEHLESLRDHGFAVESFGERTVLLRSVPAALSGRSPAKALTEVLDYVGSDDIRGYDWEDRLLATVACHGAVRAGQDLQHQEMQEMIRLLESTDNPHSCPHGRPVMMHMSNAQLEREFQRR